jgi:hypothetical protein
MTEPAVLARYRANEQPCRGSGTETWVRLDNWGDNKDSCQRSTEGGGRMNDAVDLRPADPNLP